MEFFGALIFVVLMIAVTSASSAAKKNARQQQRRNPATDFEMTLPPKPVSRPQTQTPPRERSPISHTVTPSRESGHAHMETSLTGIQKDCPPPRKIAVETPQPATAKGGDVTLHIDLNEAARAVVLSEILGKPRAYRKYGRA
ncbi:MAG: hypothetical protein Q4C01_04175 [Clostridia bacterium]|nr:hypothetical protein [Clostridia bacterium]